MKPTRSRCAAALAAALLLTGLSAGSALAAQCNVTATPISFGLYDPLATVPTDTTGTINVTCRTPPRRPPQVVTIQLTAGNSGNFAQRSMTSATGGASLLYNLFTDPSMATAFGDGTGGSATLTSTVDRATPWTVTIYGRMPALQPVPPSTYSDMLTVTILW